MRRAHASDAGFQPVPDVLLLHQRELGLRSEDLNVRLQITTHWYFPDRMPFPWNSTIAKRMGVSVRSVQRSVRRLRRLGLLGQTKTDGRLAHDLTPLIEKLRPFAQKRLDLRKAFREEIAV
jgi:DNA replication protein DnaD